MTYQFGIASLLFTNPTQLFCLILLSFDTWFKFSVQVYNQLRGLCGAFVSFALFMHLNKTLSKEVPKPYVWIIIIQFDEVDR